MHRPLQESPEDSAPPFRHSCAPFRRSCVPVRHSCVPFRHSCASRNPGNLVAASRPQRSDGLPERCSRAVGRLRREPTSAVRLDSCVRRNDGDRRRNDGISRNDGINGRARDETFAKVYMQGSARREGRCGLPLALCAPDRPPSPLRGLAPCVGAVFGGGGFGSGGLTGEMGMLRGSARRFEGGPDGDSGVQRI